MTTKPDNLTYLRYWLAALKEEIGILIRVAPEDQNKFIAYLMDARKLSMRPELDAFMVFQPAPRGTVYIARKSTEVPE